MSTTPQDSEDDLILRDRLKMKIALFYKPLTSKAILSICLLLFIATRSITVYASFLSSLLPSSTDNAKAATTTTTVTMDPVPETIVHNSQNIPLLESSINPDVKNIKDEAPAPVAESPMLLSSDGSLSADYDLEANVSTEKINTYTVKKGDTLDSISKKLKIPKSTIITSNADLKKKDLLKIGQELVLLSLKPQAMKADVAIADKTTTKNGTKTVKDKTIATSKTDTTKNSKTIAKPDTTSVPSSTTPKDKSKDTNNDNSSNSGSNDLALLAPKTDVSATLNTQVTTTLPVAQPISSPLVDTQVQAEPPTPTGQSGTIGSGYIWPFAPGVGRVSQGLHADSAYDFSAPIGTPIHAVQNGTVFLVHPTGYNGGYGKYVVINFDDGRQAIFGHMNETNVEEGQKVNQGDVIGFVGMTGKTTGPHVHIGFHGDLGNPYKGLKVNSKDVQIDE